MNLNLNMIIAAVHALILAGCVTYPVERNLKPYEADISRSNTDFSVMTYNIEGLPWPARTGRRSFLDAIGRELERMDENGILPDVIVFQEAFSTSALKTASNTPHPVFLLGPRASSKSSFQRTDNELLRHRNLLRGEWGIKFLGSGLAIASRFPVSIIVKEPFGSLSCVGWDCLSNKGMILARVHVPTLAVPVEVLTLHMNSQGSSGVSVQRQLAAHETQSAELSAFINQNSSPENPLIVAGDFNMRGSPRRFDEFERHNGANLARRYCIENQRVQLETKCEIALSFDGDEPWMDTQDLQIFDNGKSATLRPIRLEAWFDGDDSGGRLSDHDAYVVTYSIVSVAEGAQR
jgi:endonuclease/exonuclease/phosphatase family metal-dependent hydrolase